MNERWNKENLSGVILTSKNKMDVLTKIGLKPFTGNYDTLNKYIKLYNINITHFSVCGNVGLKRNKMEMKDILVTGSTYGRYHLKKRLYADGLKEKICEECGQDELWFGNKISLILDHINGINDDNRIENLRILCPNCNASLPTHGGKNVKKYEKDINVCIVCNKTIKNNNISGYCIEHYLEKRRDSLKQNFCECGVDISVNSTKCKDCHNIGNRKVERPSIDVLTKEVKELGYSKTGRKYGVSDNAIRKWLK